MFTVLFIIISFAFVGTGLPDSVLGTAWPVMYPELGLSISLAGYITAAISVGKIISSLLSTRLTRKLGTGLLSAISILIISLSLVGFATVKSPVLFFVWALPLGFGTGIIDTVLNTFAAFHYSASQLSFMQCFYGIGAVVSPFVMSVALGPEGNWRRGYFVVAAIQFFIAILSFIALPVWFRVQKKDRQDNATVGKSLSIPELLRPPRALLSAFCFFSGCAIEWSAGSWSSSYFVNVKEMPAENAATVTMLFYIGLAFGRFLSGLTADKLGRRKVLRLSLMIIGASILVFALPLPTPVTVGALFCLGLGIGPICPNLVHITPKYFGGELAQSVMALQKAMTYLGIMLMPAIFGALADAFTVVVLPYYLILMFAIYALALLSFIRKKKKKADAE